MEQLISMRQRIKAVETIKKITHAMRLISMSTHARLRNKKDDLQAYKDAFLNLWNRVQPTLSTKHLKSPEKNLPTKKMVIIVGSQKGLCGTFNTNLWAYIQLLKLQNIDYYVSVGKLASDFLKSENKPLLSTFDVFNSNNFVSVAQSITQLIISVQNELQSVILISNHPKSFFVHEPKKTDLFSLEKPTTSESGSNNDYTIEQDPLELAQQIEQLMLMVHIQELLYGSLLAEQSARFVSMDSATQNAEGILQDMRLQYNKIRQASITRELSELSSSY